MQTIPIKGVVNAMSVDVEDYFQVQALTDSISCEDWPYLEQRVERNTQRVLELFAQYQVRATFFTLGWVAERYKHLIRQIIAAGHELASHGYWHIRADQQTPDEFRADIRRTKTLLEDIGGVPINGYRAASFSIGARNLWAHKVLAEEGYRYSSSVFPVRHDLYGMPNAPRFVFKPSIDEALIECPLTSVALLGRNFPCSGGGYFRLFPYSLSRWLMRKVSEDEQQPCIFYFHPWEIDPDQPRQSNLCWKSRFRHYVNLARMEQKVAAVLQDFQWDRMDAVFLTNDRHAP